ncbi:MAG: hypothetical protein D6729_14585, partial [Deltaproteobacteria bacterium]
MMARHLQDRDVAAGRRAAWLLLAQVVERGVEPATAAALSLAPELAPHLEPPVDFDAQAARHYALFGLAVYPYAGLFLDRDGEAGSPQILAWYERHGFSAPASQSADHVGSLLRFLATLPPDEARAFAETVLLPMLPPLLVAVSREGDPLYEAIFAL